MEEVAPSIVANGHQAAGSDLISDDQSIDLTEVSRILSHYHFRDFQEAQELILSGRVMSAEQLHRLGVVDVVATDGQGETAVRNWIAKNAKRRNGLQALLRARQFFHPITRQELDGIVALWVDAAMRLGERDLRMMQRLARAQLPMAQPEIEAGVQAHSPAEEPLAAA